MNRIFFIRHMPRRMRAQMSLALSALVMIPLILLGFLLIGESRNAVRTTVLRDEQQLATRAAADIEEFMKHPRELLALTASLLGTQNRSLWEKESLLVELVLDEEIFTKVSLLNTEGQELSTSNLGVKLENYGNSESFNVSRSGLFYTSPVFILPNKKIPLVIMSTPVFQKGKLVGVLMGWVNLRGLWKKVDEIRIGRTGRAYLVSEKGILLAHEDKKKVISQEDFSNRDVVQEILAEREGSREFKDEQGKVWLESYALIKSLNWGLVVRQASKEAYSFSNKMTGQSALLILLSLAVTLLVSIFFARALVSPIRLLADKMHLVAQGNLNQRLPFGRKDEIGLLMGTFNRMTQRLKEARQSEKLALIGRAAAAITHELKNSLVMVSTFINLLPSRYEDPLFVKQMSEVLPQEINSWKGMLDDISNYSKHLKLEMEVISFNKVMSEFIMLVQQRFSQSHVELVTDIPLELPMIHGNAQKIKQALMNLVMNALEAMPAQGVLSIAVGTPLTHSGLMKNNQLEIKIHDNGVGIPQERQAYIFNPFYTTKPNGLGLGLAICKEIVEKHNGTMEMISKVGLGSIFIIKFPIVSTLVNKSSSDGLKAETGQSKTEL